MLISNVIKTSPHYLSDKTLFCMCEKVRRRFDAVKKVGETLMTCNNRIAHDGYLARLMLALNQYCSDRLSKSFFDSIGRDPMQARRAG
jgi:hypothetical protein